MRQTTASTVINFTLLALQLVSPALSFSTAPRVVIGTIGPQKEVRAITSPKRRSQLCMLDECFGAVTGSFLMAGSEMLDATAAAMDGTEMMTPEYAALDSDPAISLALGVMFVTFLISISLGAEQEETKAGLLEDEKAVTAAPANKFENISKIEMASKDSVTNQKAPIAVSASKSTSNSSQQMDRDIPLEVGAILKAYKEADDDLFLRALSLLVGRIKSTNSELNETKRLFRAVKEEKRKMEDQYELRKYQLEKAEEKLKQMRSK
ncbi:unnamed protein product [Cylindrotheca closterium]|uniref:Mediator of RNA polymerase II transcription subunit 7 n=1 Tax=Cylindrotheca closterium TaxID=2856 RepID=A0AAD2FWE6_9STRA|nr:unnamed protein product [Cylindrotheca closterium]